MAGRRRVAIAEAGFEREAAVLAALGGPVAGVDEVGRGPLAGPVVAAAVILDPARIPSGLADSKLLTAEERERLEAEILASALAVAVAAKPPSVIDRDNILRASLAAMAQAVAGLCVRPGHLFVDGRDVPPGLACRCEAVIGGDGLVASIAAASIVAKVHRDRLMARLDGHHPGYGFARHVGYGTPEHRAAILKLGASPHHRASFGLLKTMPLLEDA